MTFRRGQKVEIFQRSADEGWAEFMDEFIGAHGIVVDPDTSVNDEEALIEVSLEGRGTHRFPQDCLRVLEG